jgi:hypothetical protein
LSLSKPAVALDAAGFDRLNQRELWASLVSTGSTSGMALGVAGFDRLNQR